MEENSLASEFQLYLQTDSAQKTPRSAKADAYFLGIALHFFEKIQNKTLVSQIRLEDLQIFQTWLAKEKSWSDTTIEYYCRVLKKFFRKMFHLERIRKNPCDLWKVPRGTTEARLPMSLEEFEKIHAAAPDWFKPILIFIRMTGARGASVASLTWADVHFDSETLILRSKKGGLKQTKLIPIPMYQALFDFLDAESWKVPFVDPKNPLFFGPKGTPVTAQEISSEGSRLIKLVGLRGKVVLYGLRHAIGAEMTAAGIPLEITRQAMGHSSVTQTSHYAKGIASSVVKDAMNSIRGKKNEP
jgi:site-specific recombinase XerD